MAAVCLPRLLHTTMDIIVKTTTKTSVTTQRYFPVISESTSFLSFGDPFE